MCKSAIINIVKRGIYMKKELFITITNIEENTYKQLTRERLCF